MPSKKKYNARFPAGRIKKIMQSDEEVGKVAQAVPVIISRTLELFVESLLKKTVEITNAKNAKTLTPSHMKMCILSEKRFDFLTDLVKNIPDSVNEEDPNEVTNSNSSVSRRRTSVETPLTKPNTSSIVTGSNKPSFGSKPASSPCGSSTKVSSSTSHSNLTPQHLIPGSQPSFVTSSTAPGISHAAPFSHTIPVSPSYAVPTVQPPSYAVPTVQPPSYAVQTPSYAVQPPSYAVPTIQPPSYAVPTIQPPSYAVPSVQPPSYAVPSVSVPNFTVSQPSLHPTFPTQSPIVHITYPDGTETPVVHVTPGAGLGSPGISISPSPGVNPSAASCNPGPGQSNPTQSNTGSVPSGASPMLSVSGSALNNASPAQSTSGTGLQLNLCPTPSSSHSSLNGMVPSYVPASVGYAGSSNLVIDEDYDN
ncbi:DNA-directed RNA polymerase II subunit RPB1 [Diaphorina citri]|uniref:Dr1-associated corepressor n=1 Tax=Diaphorina citri TaxID=121845 RepID=A0A1S3D8V4_DIACI|nr:DNA-directed RNA polymerase II subunit RPB1 [Diaphorina citri]